MLQALDMHSSCELTKYLSSSNHILMFILGNCDCNNFFFYFCFYGFNMSDNMLCRDSQGRPTMFCKRCPERRTNTLCYPLMNELYASFYCKTVLMLPIKALHTCNLRLIYGKKQAKFILIFFFLNSDPDQLQIAPRACK